MFLNLSNFFKFEAKSIVKLQFGDNYERIFPGYNKNRENLPYRQNLKNFRNPPPLESIQDGAKKINYEFISSKNLPFIEFFDVCIIAYSNNG